MPEQNGNPKRGTLRAVILTFLIFILASGIGALFRYVGFAETNIVIVYLLAVLMTAWLTRSFIFGFVATILATFLFNYFFTDPVFTFAVNDPDYIITFVTMTITALVTGTLTSHAKRAVHDAQDKEAETRALYHLTNHLTDAKDVSEIAGLAVAAISKSFSCCASCLCFNEEGEPEPTFIQQTPDGRQMRREVIEPQALRYRIESIRTGYDAGEEFYDWPIYGQDNILGVIRIPKANAEKMSDTQLRLLRAMIESTALAMDRFRSAEQRVKTREEVVTERYRSNLLRGISHEIRTPLTGILGASEKLMAMTQPDDLSYALAQGIHKDADWLDSLMDNVSSLSRLQDGELSIEKRPASVEAVVEEAVGHIVQHAPDYTISIRVPDALSAVPMDTKLIRQVLINLLDNAVKHSKPEGEIGVEVAADEETSLVEFSVRDRGSGIRKKDLPNLFKVFYTAHTRQVDADHGIGLGLAICESIVLAHGGTIEARNRKDGPGAEIVFTLPLEEAEEV